MQLRYYVSMTEQKPYLNKIQLKPDYQLLIRDHSDKAAQGLLTLLVTINVGAFVTVIELLKDHHWLLILFTISTIASLLSRIGVYYVYRQEVTMFEFQSDPDQLASLETSRCKWWTLTEVMAWASLLSFIVGVSILTGLFIYDYSNAGSLPY